MIADLLTGIYNQSPLGKLTGATGYTAADIGTALSDAGYGALNLGAVGALGVGLHAGGLASGAIEGLHYSLGAERIFGSKMGNVMSTMSAENLSRTLGMGSQYVTYGSDTFNPLTSVMKNQVDDVFAIGSSSGASFLQKFNKTNLLFPLAATAYGAIDAYSTEGMSGLGNFMIQDVFANKYGMQASAEVFDISGASAAQRGTLASQYGDARFNETVVNKEGNTVSKYKSIQEARSGALLKSPMMFRMQSVLGGYMGASIGMEAGRTVGEMSASMINNSETLQSVLGFAGSVFGAAGGARVGAYMGGSLLRLGLMGAGLGAVSMMSSYMQDALKSGSTIKHRGLNYSGDIAAFQTQMASTMRQRSLQAMHKSHLNARSAFGQEASMVHMNRDMFGQYRR